RYEQLLDGQNGLKEALDRARQNRQHGITWNSDIDTTFLNLIPSPDPSFFTLSSDPPPPPASSAYYSVETPLTILQSSINGGGVSGVSSVSSSGSGRYGTGYGYRSPGYSPGHPQPPKPPKSSK
ncbi:unnamed protein product, partial [Didymodactylos carnosus]